MECSAYRKEGSPYQGCVGVMPRANGERGGCGEEKEHFLNFPRPAVRPNRGRNPQICGVVWGVVLRGGVGVCVGQISLSRTFIPHCLGLRSAGLDLPVFLSELCETIQYILPLAWRASLKLFFCPDPNSVRGCVICAITTRYRRKGHSK